MTEHSSAVVSVGIDASKSKLDVAFLYADRSHRMASFPNTREGIGALAAALQEQGTAETVPCIIESTGNCHLLSALMISQAGFTVNVINPLITKRYQRSSIRDQKTDAIDARRLSEIGILEKGLVKFSATPSEILAKKIVSYLGTLEKAKQSLKRSCAQLEEVGKTLGVSVDVGETRTAIEALDRQIKDMRAFIRERVANQEELRDLAKIKGVSPEQLAIVLCCVGGVGFSHKDQLVAFMGLDVRVRQSGMWQGKGKLSKRGNAYARKVIYQMAWGLKQHNETYQAYYKRLREERHKHYTTCLIAVARKFLRFLYAYHWQGKVYPQTILATGV